MRASCRWYSAILPGVIVSATLAKRALMEAVAPYATKKGGKVPTTKMIGESKGEPHLMVQDVKIIYGSLCSLVFSPFKKVQKSLLQFFTCLGSPSPRTTQASS